MQPQLYTVTTDDDETAPMPLHEARAALAELQADGIAAVVVTYPDGLPIEEHALAA